MTDVMTREDMHARQVLIDRILTHAEAHFGATVLEITAPGGVHRKSYRLTFEDRTVIATARHDAQAARLESFVMDELAQHTDRVPHSLGAVEDIVFMQDLGRKRLARQVPKTKGPDQVRLATDAAQAISEMHAAARQTTLTAFLPRIEAGRGWAVDRVAEAADALSIYDPKETGKADLNRLAEALTAEPRRFVKQDCRSGNAILSDDGRVRWFDFETCGVRSGIEDYAWLLADEIWTIPPEKMFAVVSKALPARDPEMRRQAMGYLALYATLHAAVRLGFIVREAEVHGWRQKGLILREDAPSLHPDFAARMADIGAMTAAKLVLTQPFVPAFEAAGTYFRKVAAKVDADKTGVFGATAVQRMTELGRRGLAH